MNGNLGMEKVAIALMERSHPQSILSLITESPADVGYWSDEWRIGGKSGAKIRFGSLCVREATVEGKLKTRSYVE